MTGAARAAANQTDRIDTNDGSATLTLYTNLRPLSTIDHADLRLQPLPGYGFARTATELPVHASELTHLVPVLPLAFRIDEAGARLVGITGVRAGENLFVGPKGGWTAIATPDALETYPFVMQRSGDGSGVLCVDMASDLLSRFEGERLLDDQGQPAGTLQGHVARLKAQLQDRRTTAQAIRALGEAGVLAPWQVDDVDTLDGAVHRYVDRSALQALAAETQAKLARQGALALAYAQIYAMANMRKLRAMAQARGASGAHPSGYLKDNDALEFGEDAVLDFS